MRSSGPRQPSPGGARATDDRAADDRAADGRAPDDRAADGRFTTLDSVEHFSGRIVSVRSDTITMPGGGTAVREVVDHDRAVAIVAIDDTGRIVLIEQYRHPLRRRLWELPAGLMDIAGESPWRTARRELAEETGLAADRWWTLVDLASSPGFTTETVRIFLATDIRPAGSDPADPAPPADRTADPAPADRPQHPTVGDEEDDMRVVRLPLETARTAVIDGRIVNATAVAGILAAAAVSDADGRLRTQRLRPATDPWTDGAARVHTGTGIAAAPELGVD